MDFHISRINVCRPSPWACSDTSEKILLPPSEMDTKQTCSFAKRTSLSAKKQETLQSKKSGLWAETNLTRHGSGFLSSVCSAPGCFYLFGGSTSAKWQVCIFARLRFVLRGVILSWPWTLEIQILVTLVVFSYISLFSATEVMGKSNVFPLDLIWKTHSSDNPQWRKERDIVASVSVISLWSPAAESLLLSTWMRWTSNQLAFYVTLWKFCPQPTFPPESLQNSTLGNHT